MAAPPMNGDVARPDSEGERAARIEELRNDLENSIAYRERMQEPPTSKEIATRAMDRVWQGNGAYSMFILIIIALAAAFIWAPYNFPIYLMPLIVVAPFFAAAFLREKYFGMRSRREWRDAQIAEIDQDIDEIRKELFRLGAGGLDQPPVGENPAIGVVSNSKRLH